PSLRTLPTLLIHRARAARAAQRDRALEDIVHKFPSQVRNGTNWEKHEPLFVPADVNNSEGPPNRERGQDTPSTSHGPSTPAWVDQQVECAICLEMFTKGDRFLCVPDSQEKIVSYLQAVCEAATCRVSFLCTL
ncbi:hypothetical protein BD311DRAFT_855014, partial [Dichomitus squalens]